MIYKPITEEIQKSSVGKACQTWGDSWIRKTAYYLLKQVSTSNCLSPLSSTNLMLSLIKRKRPWNTLSTTLNVLQLAKQLFFTTPSQPLSECFQSFSTVGFRKNTRFRSPGPEIKHRKNCESCQPQVKLSLLLLRTDVTWKSGVLGQ